MNANLPISGYPQVVVDVTVDAAKFLETNWDCGKQVI